MCSGRRRRLGQCGSQRGRKLIRRQRTCPPGIAVGQPLGKGSLQFVARDKPVLIQVGDGEDAGSRSPRPPPRPPGAACCASSARAPAHKAAAQTPISNVAVESLECMIPPVWTEHRTNVYPFRKATPLPAYNQGMVYRAILVSLALCIGLNAEVHPMTLRQAVARAVAQNPDVTLARLDEENARHGGAGCERPLLPRASP